MNEKELIQKVCENINLQNINSNDYIEFLNQYTIFFKAIYERLKQLENKAIDDQQYFLGNIVFSFGTDELTNPYSNYYDMLNKIDESLGHPNNNYHNGLFKYKIMYECLQNLLIENNYQISTNDCFKEITLACLKKIGFDNVKTTEFGNSIIFKIDIASRINKYFTEFNKLSFEYIKQNYGYGTLVVDNNASNHYIKCKIMEFENSNFDKYADNDDNPYCTNINKIKG